jgi:hypothetical protein
MLMGRLRHLGVILSNFGPIIVQLVFMTRHIRTAQTSIANKLVVLIEVLLKIESTVTNL